MERHYKTVKSDGHGKMWLGAAAEAFMGNLPILVCGMAIGFVLLGEILG